MHEKRLLIMFTIILSYISLFADQNSFEKGKEYFEAGKFEQAKDIFNDLIKDDPNNAQYFYYLGRTYFRLKKPDRAVDYLEKAVSLNDTSARYHMLYGAALFNLASSGSKFKAFGRAKKGRQEFERVIELDPNNLPARYSLMQFYYNAPGLIGGNKERAQKLMEEMNTIAPDSLISTLAKTQILIYQKNYDHAHTQLKQSIPLCKNKGDSLQIGNMYNMLGYEYLKTDDCDNAIAAFKMYMALAPKEPNAHDSLGEAFYKCGNIDASIAEYKKALALNPNFKNSKKMLEKIQKEIATK